MKNIKLVDGTALVVEFKPGQWAQFAAKFTTTWTHPDADGNNKALKAATDGLLADMVAAYRERAALKAVAEAASNANKAMAELVSPLQDIGHGDYAEKIRAAQGPVNAALAELPNRAENRPTPAVAVGRYADCCACCFDRTTRVYVTSVPISKTPCVDAVTRDGRTFRVAFSTLENFGNGWESPS